MTKATIKDDQQARLIALQMAVDVCVGNANDPDIIIDVARRFRDYLVLNVPSPARENLSPARQCRLCGKQAGKSYAELCEPCFSEKLGE